MGLDRLTALWTRVRDSLWFIPSALTVGAALLAILTVHLDLAGVGPGPPKPEAEGPSPVRLVFSGTADGAREILSTIAGGLITVTGVVFSVTIVALQLASTQFTPRILRNFTADRGNQVVLGVFIATFTYALLVQRVVRGPDGAAGAFVPNVSVTVAMALALTSIACLIYLIDHAARSVQASVIIDRVFRESLGILQRTLPGEIPGPVDDDVARHLPRGPGIPIPAAFTGYLQGVDEEKLLALLERDGTTFRMEPHVGDFILRGAPLMSVWMPGPEPDEDLAERVREGFILGHERTPHLDVELGVVELVDIAVKALSPAINDPTTATMCLDRLADLIVEFGRRDPPPRVHVNPSTGGVLLLPRVGFDHFVCAALDQIRHYGAPNPSFATTLLRRLAEIGNLLPPSLHPALARQVGATRRLALSHGPDAEDAVTIEAAAAAAAEVVGGGAGGPPGQD